MGRILNAPASLRWEVGNAAAAGVKRRRLTAARARQLVTDFEQVTIQDLTIDLLRAVDLASRYPLLALDQTIQRSAKTGITTCGARDMKLYTYSTARQRLAAVLEDASRDGQVQIRRQDGRVYAVIPVVTEAESPFANVSGRSVNSVTSEELLRTLREDGWQRGARLIRRSRAGRVGRTKGRAR